MSHTINPLVRISSLAGVLCKESLIWFEAFGFHYPINARPSLGRLLNILLLFCIVEILQLWVFRTGLFLGSHRSKKVWMLGCSDSGRGKLQGWSANQLFLILTIRESSPGLPRSCSPICPTDWYPAVAVVLLLARVRNPWLHLASWHGVELLLEFSPGSQFKNLFSRAWRGWDRVVLVQAVNPSTYQGILF